MFFLYLEDCIVSVIYGNKWRFLVVQLAVDSNDLFGPVIETEISQPLRKLRS